MPKFLNHTVDYNERKRLKKRNVYQINETINKNTFDSKSIIKILKEKIKKYKWKNEELENML